MGVVVGGAPSPPEGTARWGAVPSYVQGEFPGSAHRYEPVKLASSLMTRPRAHVGRLPRATARKHPQKNVLIICRMLLDEKTNEGWINARMVMRATGGEAGRDSAHMSFNVLIKRQWVEVGWSRDPESNMECKWIRLTKAGRRAVTAFLARMDAHWHDLERNGL